MASAKSYSIYQINLPERPEAVVFVNGFLARDRTGFFWMWKNLLWIRSATAKAEGCVQPFYGMVLDEWIEAVKNITVPVYLFFGGADPFIGRDSASAAASRSHSANRVPV